MPRTYLVRAANIAIPTICIITGCRDRGSHAWDVHPTQYTSRMGTARVKKEEEADTRVIKNLEERNVVDTKGKSPKQGLTSAKDLTIELPEERESPYHGLD